MNLTEQPHGKINIILNALDEKGNFVTGGNGETVIVWDTVFDSWSEGDFIKQITVELTSDRASEMLFRVFDPEYKFINSFTPNPSGKLLHVAKVYLGFGPSPKFVFKGLLTRIERSEEDTTLRFYDMGYLMRRAQKTEYHRNLDDLGIIKKLALRNGLAFVGPPKHKPAGRHKSIIQRGQTDWEFAQQRAESAGLKLYVREDTLYAADTAKTGNPAVALIFRQDFQLMSKFALSYRMPDNKKGRPSIVRVRARGKKGRRIEGKSGRHARGTTALDFKRDIEIHTQSYADRKAVAKKELLREHAFSCTVRMIPALSERVIDVRDTVFLGNVGDLFTGNYLLSAVKYDLVPGALITDLELYRDIDN